MMTASAFEGADFDVENVVRICPLYVAHIGALRCET
jgi:hypothetical protein